MLISLAMVELPSNCWMLCHVDRLVSMTFCCWYVILCPTRKCRNFSLMSADICNIFLELFQRQTTERQMRSKCNLLYPTNVICLTLNGVMARQVRSGQLSRPRLRVFDLGGDQSEPLPFGAQQPGNLSPRQQWTQSRNENLCL